MQLTFTKTREHELNDLIAIDPIAAREPSRRDFLFEAINSGTCISSYDADALVAFAVTQASFFHQPIVELLVVSPHHRQRGIGLALLRHLVTLHATPTLWTSTNQSNTAMRALLVKAGFRHSGTIEGLDEGDPELIFRITKR